MFSAACHLGQFFLPELVSELLADSDRVVVGVLEISERLLLDVRTFAALWMASRSASDSTQDSRTAGFASGLQNI